jgi:L-histidine Nalpha-methyltransferase
MSPATATARAKRPSGAADPFAADVLAGLALKPRRLPSKWFYDARGSALFERICEQPEYYLTRVELDIMQRHAADIAAALGPRRRLVEFGSGAGRKTRLLLEALSQPSGYVPVEISPAALEATTRRLHAAFPALEVRPVAADFTAAFELPPAPAGATGTVVYFPGSTLGNFDGAEADALLRRMRRLAGVDGALLLGLDLRKERSILEAAYNDAAGVTAAFTLNLLARINRELDGDFALDRFRHRAVYNPLAGRIETSIVSTVAQQVQVAGRSFAFAAGESIAVEISCKYSEEDVQRRAARAGLVLERCWSDERGWFGVFLLRPTAEPGPGPS